MRLRLRYSESKTRLEPHELRLLEEYKGPREGYVWKVLLPVQGLPQDRPEH